MHLEFVKYYKTQVAPCRECEKDSTIKDFIKFVKLPPYIGSNQANVLILGHSPTVRTNSKITVTLDLNQNSVLLRYILNEILEPLGLDLKACGATNIVKCQTSNVPEEIKIDGKKKFMPLTFEHCKDHLIEEIKILNPKLIISLSERVSTILQREFKPQVKTKSMKEIFATMQTLNITGENYNWLPVVHLPKAKVRSHYFPGQTNRLRGLRKYFES